MAIFFLNLHVAFTKSFFLKKYETLFQIKHKIHQEKVQDWSAVNKICNLLLVSNQVFLGCVRTTIENSIHLVIDQVELDLRNAPARSQNVKCRFSVTFVCTEEILLGFFLSSRIITLSKILPLGPNFNLTCILYYIL